MQAETISGGAYGPSVEMWRSHYLSWVDGADVHLRSIFGASVIREQLYTEHYWRIAAFDVLDQMPRLCQAELRYQRDRLGRLEQRLMRFADRLDAVEGHFALPDTHLLLHYQPIHQIPWPRLLGQRAVRLALPLRVVQELDDLKWAHRDERVRSRARSGTAMLRRMLAPLGGVPRQLAENVSIEVLVDDEPVERAADADADVLAAAVELHGMERPVTLITGDAGLATQAGIYGIPTYEPGPGYLRDRSKADEGYDEM